MPFLKYCSVIGLTLGVALSGCSTVTPSTDSAGTQDVTKQDEAEKVPTRPFPPETLYSLLVAELAASRNQPQVMLENYTAEAFRTRDAGVAKRATLIAQYLGANQIALDTAKLWKELEPESRDPNLIIAAQLVQKEQLKEAFEYALTVRASHDNAMFQSIAAQAVNKPEPYRAELLESYNEALKQYPNDDQLLMGKALLEHFQGDNNASLRSANASIKSNEDNLAAHLLKASLLEKSGEIDKAAKVLATQVNKYPDNKRLRLRYARTLTEVDLEKAQKQFKEMVDEAPFDGDLLLSLALISKEIGDTTTAREYFEQLLYLNKHSSSAYYYLGQMSENEDNIPRALEQYRRVTEGEEYLYAASAYCRLQLEEQKYDRCHEHMQSERQRLPQVASRLYLIEADSLQNQGFYLESLDLLNQALSEFPDDIDLLYPRSAAYEYAGDLPAAEADLRNILKQQPDNPNALNALGYILTNRTNRHREAYELITRAIAQEPNNPAYIDSLGWVLYRLDRHDEALEQLRIAMKMFPNHEIAAHLGEVLWVMDKKDEARKVWKEGLKDKPDSKIIEETQQRLKSQ